MCGIEYSRGAGRPPQSHKAKAQPNNTNILKNVTFFNYVSSPYLEVIFYYFNEIEITFW